MPYEKISDLPEAQTDQYTPHQKKAFLEAFNNAYEEYGDESRAFAVAHSAAKKAGGTASPDSRKSGRSERAER